MKRLVSLWCACLIVASLRVTAAQTYQGAIRGQVRDPNGVIPGAEVVLLNEGTLTSRTSLTNEVGEYSFANVLPGKYTIKVSLAGFKTEERKGVQVATQQNLVLDFMLAIGEFSEQITVSGGATMVERLTPTVATSLDSKFLEALPIFGRNTFYAAVAAPSVIQSGDPQFVRMQDQSGASSLSIGGGPRRGNGYVLEGVPITDLINRATFIPSIEAVEDLKVQVKTYDADMGRAAGGVFNTTAKSGSNDWHGSAVFINKPEWGVGNLYFAKKADLPKPPQYYYDWAGSFGGPVVKNKTFFWASTEGYLQESTRNNVLTLPTAAQRAGDFSQLLNSAGRAIVIYDPLTTRPDPARPGQFIRDPFPGNKIPANRLNPVAVAMLSGLPIPPSGTSLNANATLDDGPQRQWTLKLDQRWSDRWTTTGMYARQHTREPGSTFYGAYGTAAGDPAATKNDRLINFVSLNNIFIPNNTTTVAVRYGYNQFKDWGSNEYGIATDAASLGLPASFVSGLTYNTFPRISVNGYGGTPLLGYTGPSQATYITQTLNATVSKSIGHHSLAMGAEYRRISADVLVYGNAAGNFSFTNGFTQGPDPNTASSTAGDAFASFLLGYPASGDIAVATPGHYFLNYYAGYVQDNIRATSKIALNLGLRYEFESGLQEKDDHFTVGFDPNAAFPVAAPGINLKGGLMYAGVNGNPDYQGHPIHNQFAPRGGVAWSLTDRHVVRAGYGFFWVPEQFNGVTEAVIGARGYTASTSFLSSNDSGLTPAGTLSNPFPSVQQPQGNSAGLATGAGGTIDFIDQNAKPGYVQQYSVDYQWELPAGNVITVGYQGSRSDRLTLGGTSDATVNINQLDPSYLSLGTALQQLVPNPFFGNAAFGNFSRSATIARGQLLRPFPQFGDVLAHRSNLGRARYDALVAKWDRRLKVWGASVNYTYGRLMDNQFGESNSFSARQGQALDNTNLDAEYGYSLLDVPHRLNVNASIVLPFGDGHRWATSGLSNALFGGWSVTMAGRYQNGFPLAIWQSSNNSGLFGSTQRPNIVPGVDPATSGDWESRLTQWMNPAAWSAAPAFTLGNAPRTDSRVRTPNQYTTDLNIQKSLPLGHKTLSVRADILNLFDQPLFTNVVTQFGLANFGSVNQVGGYPRSLQIQVRMNW
jgi:outer membrane receptor protein involved in Fe transport